MNTAVATDVVYLVVSITVTVWVARTLSRNGRIFLLDVFRADERLADAVNQLLVVGFYLVNAGVVLLFLQAGDDARTAEAAFDTLSQRLGTVLLLLGLMHLINIRLFKSLGLNSVLGRPAPHMVPSAAPTQPYSWAPPAAGPRPSQTPK